MLVLERLSKPESRVSYLESRRALRSRPNNASANYHRQSAKAQRTYKGDLKGEEEFGGLEMNDYDVSTLHIPYGPGWNARRIEKLIYQTVCDFDVLTYSEVLTSHFHSRRTWE